MPKDVERRRSAIVPRAVKLTHSSFVLAMSALNMTARIPRLFRTYQAPKYPSPNCAIWEAARATSAAPTFFEHIFIEGEPYVNGGMGCNNPVQQVLQETELMFPRRHVACIVSIGAGQARTISIPKPGWFPQLLPLKVVDAMQQIATDCEASAQVAARRFERIPGIYFRFNVEQGLQEVGLEQWERLDEVRAHTGQYIRMADVDSRLDAAVVSICGRQRVVPTEHTSTDVQIYVDHDLTQLVRKGGNVPFPCGRHSNPRSCPPPTHVFTGRQDILTKMREYFFNDLGKQHVFVLYGLGGAGKSQIAFKFVNACQVETRDPRYTTYFCNLRLYTGLTLYLSRFSDIFYVDASTKETISADLINIALSQGIGESEKATLDWFSRRREEWLLVLDNADDPSLHLRPYLPRCSHGNILITSRNRDTCFYAPQSCQVSDMTPEDARDLLFKTASLEHTNDTEALATKIVQVYVFCLSPRSMQ